MLAIASYSFDTPSETFVRAHVRFLSPSRTVLLCQNFSEEIVMGCPVLSDLRGISRVSKHFKGMARYLRSGYLRFIDPTLDSFQEARVLSFFKRRGVQVLLAEFGPNGSFLRVACNRSGVRLFVHFHGFDATRLGRDPFWRRHYRALFRDAAGIIVPSEFLADRVRLLGCPDSKLYVSPNGVDLSVFTPTVREPGRVIAVSRLVPVKGPIQMISAFYRVKKLVDYARLDIVGDGELKEECMELVERLGLSSSVKFHGAQPTQRIAELMSRASLFVQHSVTTPDGQTESFGITPLEAAASYLPVVVTRSGGLTETVLEGETGLLVEEQDIDGMADAMLKLLNNHELAEAMGRAGHARVEALFSQERTTARLQKIMGLSDDTVIPK